MRVQCPCEDADLDKEVWGLLKVDIVELRG